MYALSLLRHALRDFFYYQYVGALSYGGVYSCFEICYYLRGDAYLTRFFSRLGYVCWVSVVYGHGYSFCVICGG